MPSSVSLEPELRLDLEYERANSANSRGSSLDKSSSASSSGTNSLESRNISTTVGISDRVEEELSQLWDSGQEWILIFDNLLKHPGGKVSKGCKCDMCQIQKCGHGHGASEKSSPTTDVSGM